MNHFNKRDNTSLDSDFKIRLIQLKEKYALNQIEHSNLKKPLTIDFYEKWLGLGYNGTMSYLEKHLPAKKDPKVLSGTLKSVISVSQAYFPIVNQSPVKIPARIALYSKNNDYHHWLKNKLTDIITELKKDYPEDEFLPFVDSGPILERDLAYQNSIGWFGKNTCLINPNQGSLFFIAEILTSLSTNENVSPLPDFCGTCNKCIEVCPTEALTQPRLLNANKCISYLTIEAKETPPLDLRKKMGDWFFGCDLCQTVCPWNEKFFRLNKIEKNNDISTENQLQLDSKKRTEIIEYFKFLFTESNKKIQKFHLGSPLSRAGARGLKRNALIVTANQNLYELKEYLKLIKDSELDELIEWTRQQLS